jgi:hypothetical protein
LAVDLLQPSFQPFYATLDLLHRHVVFELEAERHHDLVRRQIGSKPSEAALSSNSTVKVVGYLLWRIASR